MCQTLLNFRDFMHLCAPDPISRRLRIRRQLRQMVEGQKTLSAKGNLTACFWWTTFENRYAEARITAFLSKNDKYSGVVDRTFFNGYDTPEDAFEAALNEWLSDMMNSIEGVLRQSDQRTCGEEAYADNDS